MRDILTLFRPDKWDWNSLSFDCLKRGALRPSESETDSATQLVWGHMKVPSGLSKPVESRMGSLYSGWVWIRQTTPWRYFIRMAFLAAGFTLFKFRYILQRIGGGSGRKKIQNEEDPGKPEELREGKRTRGSEEEEGLLKRPRVQEDEDDGESDEHRVEPTDELYCEYDSTWEPEDQQDPPKRTSLTSRSRSRAFRRFEGAARDMQNYRHDYPIRPPHWGHADPNSKPNLEFYLGRSPCLPDGVYIDDFHHGWHGEYGALEQVHTYIQWLFPLQEPGLNPEAQTLTRAEIQEFCQNTTAKENLLKSYKLMLDFYGIDLCDENTGQVQRAQNWTDRFANLNNHTHNNLRITRILKCLGTLGYAHYQEPLVHFFLEETLIHGELANVKASVLNYFIFAVRDKEQRRELLKYAYVHYDHRDEFVWCPKKIQKKWSDLMSKHTNNVVGVRLNAWDPWPTQDDGIQTKEEPSESALVDV